MRIGIGLGIGGQRRGGFSEASLFKDAAGLWLDRAGTNARFADVAGTTAATIGGGIGLRLDRSEGLVLGSELVKPASWTVIAGWSFNSFTGVATGAGVTGALRNNLAGGTMLTVGKWYEATVRLVSYTSGNVGYPYDGTGLTNIPTAPGIYTHRFLCDNNDYTYVYGTSFTGVIDNISVRELPGFHAAQSTGTFAPKLRDSGSFLYDEYDGSDDRLQTSLLPTVAGTIAGYIRGTTASRVVFGSAGATDGRCFLALDASGRLGAGIGTQSTTTIFGGADIRNQWHACAVTWDGTTARLYLDGVEVYSGAQSGAVNTTVPFRVGALNSNGTAGAFWGGDVADLIVLDESLPAATILKLSQKWSA